MKHTFPLPKFLLAILCLSTLLFTTAVRTSTEPNREVVENIINELREKYGPKNQDVYHALNQLYDEAAFSEIWNKETRTQGISMIKNSRYDGLNQNDYLYQELNDRILKPKPRAKTGEHYGLTTDVLLSYASLLYGKHMIEGKTDPEAFYQEWNYERRRFNSLDATQLQESIKRQDLQSFLDHITPENVYYPRLRSWMVKYYEGALDDSPELNFASLPLKKGQRSEDIVELKYRLSQFGSFDTDEPSDVFDDDLENAVKKFQRSMKIESDGIVGSGTLEALNMSLEEKKSMVMVNLERSRWLLHNMPEKLILVNIAGYELLVLDNSKVIHSTPVIVGKIHHETPIFHAEMKYVELNCTWTVPHSISTTEILPSIQRNPDYLKSRHFEVLRNGEVIDPSIIEWDQYSANNFPFVLRQKPGEFNSLGTMKFIFPNEYSIYIHDTPAKYLFDKEGTRAFSHGCVRVKNPKKLATTILSPQGVDISNIEEILDTKNTERIYLEDPLPVFLTYWTVFPDFPVNNDTPLHWVKDVYNRDAKILTALGK